MLDLTPQQITFISEIQNGTSSIMLEAVAGSGKTTTMVEAVRTLPPTTRILCCAFNSKIAKELKQRMPAHVTTCTLNAFGHRAWAAKCSTQIKLNSYKIGDITSDFLKNKDRKELWKPLKDLVVKAKSAGMAPQSPLFTKPILQDTDENWAQIARQHDIPIPAQPRAQNELFNMARKILQTSCTKAFSGEIDYDDQLYMPVTFCAQIPTFDIVFVDEAQDLSALQHGLILRAAKKGRLVFIGDPHQAIYGFRGASSSSMQDLLTRTEAKILPLSTNFRCGKTIIKKAQKFVPEIQACDSAPQGNIEYWEEWTLADLPSAATILCRNIAPLFKLGFKCLRENKPCFILGRDLGANILSLVRKFKGTTRDEIRDSIENWYEKEKFEAESKFDLQKQDYLSDLRETLLAILHFSSASSISDMEKSLDNLFAEGKNKITLSTIHRAKGLEWDTVFILDSWRCPAKFAKKAAEKNPETCNWMLEQENNLNYIAITRAKTNLIYINIEGITHG